MGLTIVGIVFTAIVYAALGEPQLARRDHVVEADRRVSREDGSTTLLGVRIRLPERDGWTVTISGRAAEARSPAGTLRLTGSVELSSSDGLEVLADSASYDPRTSELISDWVSWAPASPAISRATGIGLRSTTSMPQKGRSFATPLVRAARSLRSIRLSSWL